MGSENSNGSDGPATGSLRSSVGDRAGARFVRRHLGYEGRELADEPGLLRALERHLEDFAQRVHGDDLNFALVLVLQEDVLQVRAGNHDFVEAELRRGLNLRGHTADREDLSPDAEGPR